MRQFLGVVLVMLSSVAYSQTHFDTLRCIAAAFDASKEKLEEFVVHVEDLGDAILIMSESVSPNGFLASQEKFDSLTVVYSPEVAMFHFSVNVFAEITRINVRKKRAQVSFIARSQFLTRSEYENRFDFRLESGRWQFSALKMRTKKSRKAEHF